MRDIGITWDSAAMEGVIAFNTANNDLVMDDGLVTSAIISLFTDARAHDDDVLPDILSPVEDRDLRGWWGDETSEKENDSVGSRLWLLERAKITAETLQRAKRYAREALQWMIDEGAAAKIETFAERGGDLGDQLWLGVSIIKSTGEEKTFKFNLAWEATVS